MATKFEAQTLVETGRRQQPPSIELTFEDAKGERLTVSLPARIAADALVSTLAQLLRRAVPPSVLAVYTFPQQRPPQGEVHCNENHRDEDPGQNVVLDGFTRMVAHGGASSLLIILLCHLDTNFIA